jgi:hypothetical protein
MRLFLICIACISVILSGCESGKSGSSEPGIIEQMAGAPQLESYKKTKSKIGDIQEASKERNNWE